MGLFTKKPPQALSLDQAKAKLGLSPDDYLGDDSLWRGRMNTADLPSEGYFQGSMSFNGNAVVIAVNGKSVGVLADQSLHSVVGIFRTYGGKANVPVIVTYTGMNWNVYARVSR